MDSIAGSEWQTRSANDCCTTGHAFFDYWLISKMAVAKNRQPGILFLTLVGHDFTDALAVIGRAVGNAADGVLTSFLDTEHRLIGQCQQFAERVGIIRERGNT
jgi:hypothetical protein